MHASACANLEAVFAPEGSGDHSNNLGVQLLLVQVKTANDDDGLPSRVYFVS